MPEPSGVEKLTFSPFPGNLLALLANIMLGGRVLPRINTCLLGLSVGNKEENIDVDTRLLLLLLLLRLLLLLLLMLFSLVAVSASLFLFLPPYLFLRYRAHELRFSSSAAAFVCPVVDVELVEVSSAFKKWEDRDLASSRPNLKVELRVSLNGVVLMQPFLR
jgi:hypothetical protein